MFVSRCPIPKPKLQFQSRTLDWNRLKQELKRLGIRDGDVHLAKVSNAGLRLQTHVYLASRRLRPGT